MNLSQDFSAKTISRLAKKGLSVVGKQAVPAFDGDQYFTGTVYQLTDGTKSVLRSHRHVLTISVSSWTMDDSND